MLEYTDTNLTVATASAFALIAGSIYWVRNTNNKDKLFDELLNSLQHLNLNNNNSKKSAEKVSPEIDKNISNKSAITITNFFKNVAATNKSKKPLQETNQDKNSLNESLLIVGKGLETIKETNKNNKTTVAEQQKQPSCYI